MESHKKTTSQSILELVNPVPVSFDPEDDINIDSAAKVVENYQEEFSDDDIVISQFKKSVDLLEDQDARYSGRKVSRKSLGAEPRKNEVFVPGPSSNDDNSSSEEEAGNESWERGDSGESENDADYGYSEQTTDAATDDEAVDTGSSEEGEDSATDDSFSITGGAKHLAENKQVSDIASDNFQHVSNRNTNLEIEKGRCVRNQLRMWDSLLECRIHLQKCLLTANRIPSHAAFEDYKQKGGTQLKDALNKTQNFVTDLLEKFIVLREALLQSFPETRNLKSSQAGSESADEEIPSDTEEDEEAEDLLEEDVEDKSLYEPKIKKRKIDDYGTLLDTQHKEYLEYRNSTIQKWNDKTRVSSGKISSRNFSNFEQSTLKQIEQILSNRHRLIQRTQLKRSTYSPICQEIQEDENAKNEEPKESERLKEYDPEVFDDSDFYHQLLRELIERKTVGVTDPVQLGRQWLELQKLRSKMKRKIDVRATKGRRIKYVVHPKLVNFMAPIAESSWTDEAKTDLYNSLFGKKKL
ncbi:protein AATF [Schistocerca cancellata]|uniref:protein AATF n=1 Tax=Schistocerca cancellata TaxID=274614 RepID=UPI002117AB17|nr:protein AATF [Schistocerca cancellata]